MQRLFAYIRRYWLRYIFGILCTIATAVLLTIIPRLSGEATNAINHGDYPRLVDLPVDYRRRHRDGRRPMVFASRHL